MCVWCVEQILYHTEIDTRIPTDLHNQSMVVQGWIRTIQSLEGEEPISNSIRAIRLDVFGGMDRGTIGCSLDDRGTGVGRHHSDHFMDLHWFVQTFLTKGIEQLW